MSSVENLTTVEYYRPWMYPKQLEAIFSPARISTIEASTKAGKTVACIAWIVEQAMLGGGGGRNYWWVAPVTSQADTAFTRLVRFLPQGTFTATRAQQRKTVVLLNGAIIWFKSADKPDSLYGDDVYAAVLDEASRMKESAWHAVRSTLTFTKGPVRIIGNVKGRKNWFYKLARQAEQSGISATGEDDDLDFHRLTAPDAVEAGVLDKNEIDSARKRLPADVFRELYMAEASDDGGNPFGVAHIRACIVSKMSSEHPAWWGWDLAKRQDFTVGVGMDLKGNVCRLERFHGIPWPDIMLRIINVTNGLPALVDSTGVGDPVVDHLKRSPGSRFEGYHFTSASKQKLMEGLAVTIQSRETTFEAGPLVDELEQFEYEVLRTGVRYTAPVGLHDDCVCAMALADMCRKTIPPAMQFTDEMVIAALQAPRTRFY